MEEEKNLHKWHSFLRKLPAFFDTLNYYYILVVYSMMVILIRSYSYLLWLVKTNHLLLHKKKNTVIVYNSKYTRCSRNVDFLGSLIIYSEDYSQYVYWLGLINRLVTFPNSTFFSLMFFFSFMHVDSSYFFIYSFIILIKYFPHEQNTYLFHYLLNPSQRIKSSNIDPWDNFALRHHESSEHDHCHCWILPEFQQTRSLLEPVNRISKFILHGLVFEVFVYYVSSTFVSLFYRIK